MRVGRHFVLCLVLKRNTWNPVDELEYARYWLVILTVPNSSPMTVSRIEVMHEPLATATATDDREILQDLGRACAEIVHDVRNELNALNLYATARTGD